MTVDKITIVGADVMAGLYAHQIKAIEDMVRRGTGIILIEISAAGPKDIEAHYINIDTVRLCVTPDQPPIIMPEKPPSWEKKNRGRLSKKQRRIRL